MCLILIVITIFLSGFILYNKKQKDKIFTNKKELFKMPNPIIQKNKANNNEIVNQNKLTPNENKNNLIDINSNENTQIINIYGSITNNLIKKTTFYPDQKTINLIEKYNPQTKKCLQIKHFTQQGTLFCVIYLDHNTQKITKIIYYQDNNKIDNESKYSLQTGKKISHTYYLKNGVDIDYIDKYNEKEEISETIHYIVTKY
ncbi:hypothetical protein BBA70_01435 [New Jersey aster yellows phytoplasma]|uniref:DUF2963 domain-containing protein n=1 Tax=New Jersey aster yellows phytoplasma TaxID=270520 RepID=A0ABX4K2J7_9MOLU|nr:hypothetical protein BBA70_01435 [New Jersey aster yellows phytoplasma]